MPPSSPKHPLSVRITVSLCFFATGAAGLIYEILWNKTLVLFMGNTAYALATLLTVFMGGLALGAWIGGKLAPDGPKALRLYGTLEILLGIYCLALPFLLPLTQPLFETVYQSVGDSIVAMSLIQFLILGLLLLIPTTLMGATLPILVRFITTSLGDLSRSIGTLYALNSGGAFVGAMLAGFVIVPKLGITSSYYVAVTINIVVGVTCMILASRVKEATTAKVVTEDEPVEATGARFGTGLLLFGFGLSGFAAMVYQVAWTRAITLAIGSYSYAFTLIAGAFILGLTVGSLVIGRFGDRPVARWILPGLPILIAWSALFTVPALGNLPIRVTQLMLSTQDFASLETAYFFAIFLIILLPTFGMGGLLPLVARHLARTRSDAGRVVGIAYSSNTIGTILGAFTCGFVSIPLIGMRNSILLGTALSAIVGAVFLHAALRDRKKPLPAAAAGALLVIHAALIMAMPAWDKAVISSGPWINSSVYARSGDAPGEQIRSEMKGHDIVFYREGVTGVVTVVKKAGLPLRLYVGGKNEAIDLSPTQNWLGHLPNFLRPNAKRALVIGLGSSATLGSVARHKNIEHIDCVEISAGVVEAVRLYFSDINRDVLNDPRVHLRIGDGRQHLEYSDSQYDIIVSQPANPWLAGASAMFTQECFESMKRHLRPGGLACIWFGGFKMPPHTFQSLCATWGSVWKHPSLWQSAGDGDYLFIGSSEPLSIDFDAVAAKMREPLIAEHLNVILLPTPAHAFGYLLAADDGLRKLGEGQPTNTDDNSRIAYDTPLSMWRSYTLDIFFVLHSQRVDPWKFVRSRNTKSEAFQQNRALGQKILESQADIHEALTLRGPGSREKSLQILTRVLKFNKFDPMARLAYQIVMARR
jgi:spermidine synthase